MGKSVAGIAIHHAVGEDDGGPASGQKGLPIPGDAKAILLVEGATDEQYLRLAAEICQRPELLRDLHIVSCKGAADLASRAVALRVGDRRPMVALFDRDPNGRASREMLISRFAFSKQQLLTYGDVLEGNSEVVEAEDLFPGTLLQGFVDTFGQESVLSERVMDPHRHVWHFGFNAHGKELIATYLRGTATCADLGPWVRLLEMIRSRAGLTVPRPPDSGHGHHAGTSEGAYDWSKIDRAVRLLRAGQWTTYGDLAQLGGTAPLAVGQHLAASQMPGAYRVLDSFGRVRPGFRWVDGSDARDPIEVLVQEGLRFDAGGAASESQRLRVADLESLLDDATGQESE